jgi:hypothetical protein
VTTHHVLPEDADPFFREVQEDYDAVEAGGDPPRPPELVHGLREEVQASGLFEIVAERRYRWDVCYGADAYVDLLSTYSPNLAMAEERRKRLFDLIRVRIGAGSVRKTHLATLDVARRR